MEKPKGQRQQIGTCREAERQRGRWKTKNRKIIKEITSSVSTS
jgi:hypothetical protein